MRERIAKELERGQFTKTTGAVAGLSVATSAAVTAAAAASAPSFLGSAAIFLGLAAPPLIVAAVPIVTGVATATAAVAGLARFHNWRCERIEEARKKQSETGLN
jgi:hypothetical protein